MVNLFQMKEQILDRIDLHLFDHRETYSVSFGTLAIIAMIFSFILVRKEFKKRPYRWPVQEGVIVESKIWEVATAKGVRTFVDLSVDYRPDDEELVRARFQGRYIGCLAEVKKPKLPIDRVIQVRVCPKNPKLIALEMDNPDGVSVSFC